VQDGAIYSLRGQEYEKLGKKDLAEKDNNTAQQWAKGSPQQMPDPIF
jgi:Flp pilus assembly protein TadD